MKKLSKVLLSLLVIAFVIVSLVTQKNAMNIDDLAYTLAIGIDKRRSE